MNKQPLLSLIIPVYNTEIFIGKCLDSIFAQTYKNIEVIIVNNGSSGNIDEIVDEYRRFYPKRIIKLVKHAENQGTFHGRGSGMSVADGEYFTFMDADDRIGQDYFYQMINAAIEKDAEIVVTDLVHEDESGQQFRYIIDPVRFVNFDLRGKENVFDYYYSFKGYSYSMYGIWNKIYSYKLWERCVPFINEIDEKFALCEDAVFTTIFFSQAESAVNIHDEYYYHFVHSASESGSLVATLEKAKRSTRFQATAFRQMRKHLIKAGLYERYKENYRAFRDFHIKVMLHHIENSKFSIFEKNNLKSFCMREFEINNIGDLTNDEMFFTQNFVEQTPYLEELKSKIIDDRIKVVSFNVFNTAIVEDLWNHKDLFGLIQNDFNCMFQQNIDYVNMRKNSEKYARENIDNIDSFKEDINIYEIYDCMSKLYGLNTEDIKKLIELEIIWEGKICESRKSILHLFNLAKRCGKKIVFIADTYYTEKQISDILVKNGYRDFDDIYISNEYQATKHNGNLYNKIKEKFNVRNKQILHIGGDYLCDVELPGKSEINTQYYPDPYHVINNISMNAYAGNFLRAIYGNDININNNLISRTKMAIISNLCFDNPYVKFHQNTKFNGDPYFMGCLAGGLYIEEVVTWITNIVRDKKNNTIAFIGKDCRLIKEAFEALNMDNQYCVDTRLIDLEDEDNSIPFIFNKEHLLKLHLEIDITTYNGESLIKKLTSILNDDFCENYRTICEKESIFLNKKFTKIHQFNKFIALVSNYFDENKAQILSEKFEITESITFATGFNIRALRLMKEKNNETKLTLFREEDSFQINSVYFESKNINYNERILLNSFFGHINDKTIGTKMITRTFKKGVLDYINESKDKFSKYNNFIMQGNIQLRKPMWYLLECAGELDTFIFDSKNSNQGQCSIRERWINNILEKNYINYGHNIGISYDILNNKLQKLIFLVFFDRKRMKDMVKIKFNNHKVLLVVMGSTYKNIVKIKKKIFNESR